MSFGFAVGDFLAVLELANKVRQRWSDAPGEYAAVREEIKQLEGILRDLNDLSDSVDISASQKATLTHAIARCRTVLTAANKVAETYSTSSSNRLRRTWKRFKADPDDVRHMRDQLVSVVSQLQVVQSNVQIELDRDLLDGLQDLNRNYDDEKKMKIANWFSSAAFAEQQTAQLYLRQPGTATWFLQHAVYQTWRDGAGQTLFCPGIAGSGKSVIFATAVNDLQDHFEQESKTIVVYFYCNYKRRNEQSLPQILAALARQLFQEQSSIPTSVQTAYEKHSKRGSRLSVAELQSLVEHLAGCYSRVFLLIDALDECNSDDDFRTREKLLSYLIGLQSQSRAKINLFTTCRPGVVSQFSTCPQIEIKAQPEDVATYLRANIVSAVACIAKHPVVQRQITDSIASIVDGMFLLARLHLESLRDKTNIRAVRKAIEALPRGSESTVLDKTYDEALERINQQAQGFKDLARRTLTWITCARNELSLDELREALAIQSGMDDVDPDLDLDDEASIILACAGLVIIDEESGVVRLAHYTTQAFLERNQERWLPDGRQYVAKSCIDYLSMSTFYANGMTWGLEFWGQAQQNKMLHYVGKNWGFHCCELKDVRSYADSRLCDFDFRCFASQLALGDFASHNESYCWDWGGNIMPLHICAYFGDREALLYLLEQSHDVNSTTDEGRTALHFAVASDHNKIVAQLLARQDINVNIQNTHGDTPVHIAAHDGHLDIVSQLLARQDLDVNIENENGHTPLHNAAQDGHLEIVSQLLARQDIEVNAQSEDGQTPLHSAVYNGYQGIVSQLLLQQDIDVNAPDHDGNTPLYVAAWRGHAWITSQLLARQDIDVNIQNAYSSTPLHVAAHEGHLEIISQFLMRQDVDVNIQDRHSVTPVHDAAIGGHTDLVSQLLCRPDIQVDANNTELVRQLDKLGIDWRSITNRPASSEFDA